MSVIGTRIAFPHWIAHFVNPAPLVIRTKCAYAAFERAVEPLHSRDLVVRPPKSSFKAKAGSKGRCGFGNDARTRPRTNAPNFHTAGTSRHERLLVKIDRSASLSLVIRHLDQSGHSSFRRRPESRGVGRGGCSTVACPSAVGTPDSSNHQRPKEFSAARQPFVQLISKRGSECLRVMTNRCHARPKRRCF